MGNFVGVCLVCDTFLKKQDVVSRVCLGCGARLAAPKLKTNAVLLLAGCALLIFISLFFPFLEIKAGSYVQGLSLGSVAVGLDWYRYWWLGIPAVLLLYVLPVIYWLGLVYVMLVLHLGYRAMGLLLCVRVVCFLRHFGFLDIFFFSVFVALIKASDLADISFHVGVLNFFMLLCVELVGRFYWNKRGLYWKLKNVRV